MPLHLPTGRQITSQKGRQIIFFAKPGGHWISDVLYTAFVRNERQGELSYFSLQSQNITCRHNQHRYAIYCTICKCVYVTMNHFHVGFICRFSCTIWLHIYAYRLLFTMHTSMRLQILLPGPIVLLQQMCGLWLFITRN